jgi:hypothetical protein
VDYPKSLYRIQKLKSASPEFPDQTHNFREERMTDQDCDFFLASREHRDDWSKVRCCSVIRSMKDTAGKEYFCVSIEPPVIGQPYGLGDRNITAVFVTPHYDGASLSPLSDNPLPVLIFRPMDDMMPDTNPIDLQRLKLAAWGEIYKSKAEAEANVSDS